MSTAALHRLFLAPAVPSSLCALARLRGRLVAETRTLFRRCALLRLAVLRAPPLLLRSVEGRQDVTPAAAAVPGGGVMQAILQGGTADEVGPWDGGILMSGLSKWTGKNKRKLKKANHGARPCNHVGRHDRRIKQTRYRNVKGKGY
jgi:hypothetical protein